MKALQLLLMASNVSAVTPQLVEQIISIESGNVAQANGDGGLARGCAQFHFAAWLDTSSWRKARGLSSATYAQAYDPATARAYLDSWLTLNATRFQDHTGRAPTGADLYAIHNLGFEGFLKAKFDLANCPAITRRKAKLIR